MPRSRCSRRARATVAIAQFVLCSALAWAQAPVGEPLYLEVFINGQPTGLIANFVQRPGQRLAITVTELAELRIRSDRVPVDPNGLVDLDRYSGLRYQYDHIQQTISIEVGDQGRVPFVVDTATRRQAKPDDAGTTGAVMNYTLFGSTNAEPHDFAATWRLRPSFSAGFDARAFGPFGIFSQSALINSVTTTTHGARLESTWSYSNADSLTTSRAGDAFPAG